jgi:uncharacterized protein (DUF58 family)
MIWSKYINGRMTFEVVTIIACILLLSSFYSESYWISFLGCFLLVMCRMSVYYLNHVSDELELENNRETIRLSIEDETVLILKFSQFTKLPIYRGKIRLKLDSIVEGVGVPFYATESDLEFTIPFYLKGKETIEVPIPLKAVSRGATRIKTLDVIIPNFFGYGSVELKYNPFIHKEIIVHPTPISVPHMDKLFTAKSQGDFPTPTSIYEQTLTPIGTRDYVQTDSFGRIHWKASAKTQTLQTKVFEKTAHYSWTFVINLREPNMPSYHLGVVENLETIASNVAYMGQFATKKGIEFEVFVNLRMATGTAVYHLPKGGGSKQLGKVLDLLARINVKGQTVPISRMFHYVEKQQQNSPVMIFCGPSEEATLYLMKIKKKGQMVHFLQDDQHSPAVVPFG